jgi:hypothetical protein
MSTTALLLTILAAWWLLLSGFVLRNYCQGLQEVETPSAPERIEQYGEPEESKPARARLHLHLIVPPITIVLTLFLLPLYLYGWFLEGSEQQRREA